MKYYFPNHIKGDTFDGVEFEMSEIVDGVESSMNLTDCELLMQLKKTSTSTAALTLTETSGLTITDAVNGVFQVDNQIIDIDAATYIYDIQFTFPNGTVKTYIEGTWQITQDVSNE